MAINSKYVQAQTFQLQGSGVSEGNTSMILTSFKLIDGVTPITMSDFGIIGYGTCEPGSGTNEEQISFTGVVQNVDGSATLTGISTVLDVYPYTGTANFAQGHAGGTAFVVSNTAGFYGQFAAINNDETITGLYTFTTASRPVLTVDTDTANNAALVTFGQLARTSFAGVSNATTSVQGIVQLATQAQYDSKTLTGSTGAALVSTPNLNRATKYNDYVVDTGTANAYAIAPSPAISSYVAGQQFTFLVGNTNTGASDLSVNGVGGAGESIVKNGSSALTGGELIAGSIVSVVFDGTNFQLTENSSIQAILSKKISLGLTPVTVTNTTGNLFSVSIPGGKLGTANAIRVRVYINGIGMGASSNAQWVFTYGGSTVSTCTIGDTSGQSYTGASGYLDFLLQANGSTGSQIGMATVMIAESLISSAAQSATASTQSAGAVSVDSTTAQNLVLQFIGNATFGSACTMIGYSIDLIS